MSFKFNERGMNAAIEQIRQQAERQANAEMQRIIWDVRNEMVGQPADQVQAELVRRLTTEIAGLQPNMDSMRQIAEAIEADDLTR